MNTKKVRKLKKSVKITIFIIFIILIFIIFFVNYKKHTSTISYKLGKLGYDKEEIETIKTLDHSKQEDILTKDYDKNIVEFLKEKYFIYDNLDRYIKYKKLNPKDKISDIVSLVNVNRDRDYYTEMNKTNIELENLILVNKYYQLDKDFKFDDIVEVSNRHCYGEQSIRKEVYDKFIEMFNAAKLENLTIIINSSYRPYDYQENLWNRYARENGEKWADKYAARAGSSEHQTGLAIDVTTYNAKQQGDFEKTDEFTWMTNNAYKYGFILRYPKDKENITGYSYEPWHYRYVGKKVAEKIHNLGITYDEYYEYYLK